MNDLLVMLVTVTAAGFIHSAAGFGSALISMPMLAHLFGIQTAAPLVALQGLITSSSVLIRNRRGLDTKGAGKLILSSMLGIPLGGWALEQVDEGIVTGFLALVLIGYAIYSLIIAPRIAAAERATVGRANSKRSNSRRSMGAWVAGFLSGILAGAYNTGGPPLIIYGAIKKWPREQFKSILQSVFLVNGALVVARHAAGGLITGPVLRYYLYSAPLLLVGIFLGTRVDRLMSPEQFRKLVLVLILLLGVSLLVL
ncbi:MAG: sulfite exporter TauE/SafE family protein [Anaerolineales bacterium]|nr:sulfite exporter TauE/SafE family protein [Anaerolineales bacterium]